MFTLASSIKHAPKWISSIESLLCLYACTFYQWKCSDFQYAFCSLVSLLFNVVPSASYEISANCVLPAYRKTCVAKCII